MTLRVSGGKGEGSKALTLSLRKNFTTVGKVKGKIQ